VLAVLVTPTFAKAIKKLHAKEKVVVDKAVKAIARRLGRSFCTQIQDQQTGSLAGLSASP
jgi:hypothetical protein